MNGKYVAAVRTDAWTASTEAVRDGGELASALLCDRRGKSSKVLPNVTHCPTCAVSAFPRKETLLILGMSVGICVVRQLYLRRGGLGRGSQAEDVAEGRAGPGGAGRTAESPEKCMRTRFTIRFQIRAIFNFYLIYRKLSRASLGFLDCELHSAVGRSKTRGPFLDRPVRPKRASRRTVFGVIQVSSLIAAEYLVTKSLKHKTYFFTATWPGSSRFKCDNSEVGVIIERAQQYTSRSVPSQLPSVHRHRIPAWRDLLQFCDL